MLALLLKEKPNIKTDKDFLEAGFFLKEKMIEKGLIKNNSKF